MKKKELKTLVKTATKGMKAADVDSDTIALAAMQAGCTMAMANREIPKMLVKLGLREDPSIVRNAIATDVGKLKLTFKDVAAMRKAAEKIAKGHDVETSRVVKAIRARAKKEEVELPRASNLGDTKNAIIAYFASNKGKKTSIDGLAAHLMKAIPAKEGVTAEDHADKMLREARMTHAFASALVAATK